MKGFWLWLVDYFHNHLFQSRNHQYNWKQAGKVKKKLQSFEPNFRFPKSISYLRKINPYVFEELILMSIQQAGYRIQRNKGYSADGGVDGSFLVDGEVVLIQAKRYALHINKSHVEAFAEIVKRKRAVGGVFVHTGKTGEGAYLVGEGSLINFISGQGLIDLIIENKINPKNLYFTRENRLLKKQSLNQNNFAYQGTQKAV